MGPLNGIRVLELAAIGPAPFAGMYLSDLGAEVIRIDRVGGNSNPLASNAGPMERGKRSINVDLKSAEGRTIFLDLVSTSDVLLEGFRPGVTERLGVGPDECLQCNPKLVYARMTGWGQEGPLSESPGHDINYIGIAGPLAHIGRKGEQPSVPLNLLGDFGGGSMFVIVGILSALLAVKGGGLGQVVDAAMVDGAAYLASPLFTAYQSGFWTEERGSNLLDSGAPFYDVYATSDEKYMAVGAIEPKFYRAFIEGLGLDIEDLPPQNDRSHWPKLKREIQEIFSTRTREEWTTIFSGTDACVTPVLTMGESPLYSQAIDRQSFFVTSGVTQPQPPPIFSNTTSEPELTSEVPGQSTTEILHELGKNDLEIEELRKSGIVS